MSLMSMIPVVDAHCDVPCGIYETDTMKHAADTCVRMVEIITGLGELDNIEKHNTFVRSVMTKEKHAQLVKDQLYLLWTDYFKPEHLEAQPDLHDVIWKAVKQASKVKQTISADETHALLHAVADVAERFAKTKQ